MSLRKKVEAAQQEVKQLWTAMCEAEGVPADVKFVVFSNANPYKVEYDEAVATFFNAAKKFNTAQVRNKRALANRAAMRDVCESLGVKQVRGSVTGTIYYE
ncbi:MAG: hypothetical protein ACRDRL_29465 [Sciscionella sp.]